MLNSNKIFDILVEKDFNGFSLLKFSQLKLGLSKIIVHKFIRKKLIFINDTVADSASIKVFTGYKINFKNGILLLDKKRSDKVIPQSFVDLVKKMIVHENEHVFVLNKPYGFCVQGGDSVLHSIDEVMSQEFGAKVVHRIDKDTCGILVFAKTSESARLISDLFAQNKVYKRYLAVCYGVPRDNKFSSNDRIRDETRREYLDAKTDFNVLKFDKVKNLSLIEAFPLTGRKHQIRIHLSRLMFPIVGEVKYHDDKKNKLNLCSSRISIPEVLDFELKDLPSYFLIT